MVVPSWAAQWRVTFNASKTVYLIVSNRKNIVYPYLYLNGQVLTRVCWYWATHRQNLVVPSCQN